MTWKPYDLDHLAHEIVLRARDRDTDPKKPSLNQAYKMRANCAYGLERFWGEHLRLASQDRNKAAFVADVWTALAGILARAGLNLPSTVLTTANSEAEIQQVAEQLWSLQRSDQQNALAVLTALCDSVVWWTQRLKPNRGEQI